MAKDNSTSKKLQDVLDDLVANQCKSTGLSRNQIAREIGITPSALSAYCSATKEAGIHSLRKIADYYNVSTDYLLGKNKCKSASHEDIMKQLGLSDLAIERLENANSLKEVDFSLEWKLYSCNFIIENMNTSPFLDYLYRGIFVEYGFPNGDDSTYRQVTDVIFSRGEGQIVGSHLYCTDVREAYFAKAQFAIAKMKEAYDAEREEAANNA